MDLIISCLDVFRANLPMWIKGYPESAECDLISMGNPFGPPYPAIGIHCKKVQDFALLPGFIELYDVLEAKMTDEKIKEVIDESKKVESITREELKKVGVYSEPVKYK